MSKRLTPWPFKTTRMRYTQVPSYHGPRGAVDQYGELMMLDLPDPAPILGVLIVAFLQES